LGRCELHLNGKISIGNRVVINDGAILLTASHNLTDPGWGLKVLPILIEDYAWISRNAIILPGVVIGRGAVIGAGAVVRKSVPPLGVVFGNPATLHTRSRTTLLDYSPVLMNAQIEAWVGPRVSGHAEMEAARE
jgi:maltose O-acetyltransferase